MRFLRNWRFLLLSLVAIGAVAAFAACGGDDEGDGGGTASPGGEGSPAAGERQQGGTITVQSNDIESMDPHFSSFVQDIALHRMIWRGLYSMDKENVPQPAMADGDPEISADGTVYTIKIKEDATWSDGEQVVADDFVMGIKRTCNPNIGGVCHDFYYAGPGPDETVGTEDDVPPDAATSQTLEDAIGAKAIDDKTVEITLTNAQPTFPIILSLWLAFPVPSHLERFDTQTADQPAEWGKDPAQLVYNGPYVLESYATQDRAVLTPNPEWSADYSPEGVAPTLDELVIRFIDKKDVADNAFRNGELDEADGDNSVLPALEQEFGDEYFLFPQPGTRGMEINVKRPPLDNVEVRLALSQAIDRETLNQVALGGAFVPTTTWLPESVGGEAPDYFDDIVGYNPDSAKEHLANAGFANGEGFPTLKILIRDSPDRRAQAELRPQGSSA